MNKYFQLGINVVDDNMKRIKSKLLQYTSEENANYILNNIKLESDFYIDLNKEYKKGNDFKEFVKKENLNKKLTNLIKFNLYAHQENAVKSIANFNDTVISTGTGSGKTESFIIPIVDYCLKNSSEKGVKAIIIYPVNALANDQKRRINEILSKTELTFGIFTGETPEDNGGKEKINNYSSNESQIYTRKDIISQLPDILITNYAMLDRILTNEKYNSLIINSFNTLKYVVLDEIHTYRGNKGAHLKFLLDRLRHDVKNKLVHIGCSATLAKSNKSNSIEGYLGGYNLDDFICPLFNTKEYKLIEVEHEKLKDIPKNRKHFEEINIIRNEICNGSKSISDLKNVLNIKGFHYSKDKLYNLLNKNSDILSFRVYLFLKNVQDGIKKCINCGKYYSGYNNKCTSCGSLLFYISSDNPKMMIGVIDNKKLSNNIKHNLRNKKESTFVGIVDNNYKINNNDLVIKLSKPLSYNENEIEIENDNTGDINLIYLEEKPNIFEFENNQNFFDICRSILRNIDEDNRKILSFKDSRQEVSKYKNLANDIFVSNTFLEISKFVIGNNKVDINSAYKNIENEIKLFIDNNKESSKFKEVLNDFKIWFERTLRNKNENIKITFKEMDDLSNIEKLLLEFFIEEKLIESEIILKPNTKFISYSLFSLGKINVGGEDEEPIEDSRFSKISLSEKGRNIKSFFELRNISLKINDVQNIIDNLIKKGYIYTYITNNKKEVYAIKREKLEVSFDKSKFNTLKEIIDNNFFISQTHSSEVNKKEKSEIESEFQNNQLNILFSTPTLEMGIDIGGLNIIFMQGVPPLPSNFTQRAGRAGRKDDKTALIVTLCEDENYHDMYYFQNAKNMIDGVINPPRFQVDNFSLGKKHINAFIYEMKNFTDKNSIINNVKNTFPTFEHSEISDYIKNNDFSKILRQKNNQLYDNNTFPDYSFRKDEVKIYDIKGLGKDKKEKEEYKISHREPELACKEYVVGQIKYMAGHIYKLLDKESKYKIVDSDLGKIRQYKEIYAKNANGYISRDDSTKSSTTIDIIKPLDKLLEPIEIENIIKFQFYKKLELQFINEKEYKNNEDIYIIGQILKRQGIVITYKSELISYDNMISFIALINNAIKDLYGLDDDEVKIIYDENKSIFALYDGNGNENIDFKKVFSNLKNILEYGYNKVKKCDCKEINGCYICMKKL